MNVESSVAERVVASGHAGWERKLRWLLGTRVRFLVLGLLGLLLMLPGVFGMPPVDRDESRFALASWQMASGDAADWIVPKLQDRPRLNKPPLVYWLQAGVVKAAGAAGFDSGLEMPTRELVEGGEWDGGIGWYRLVSVACALGTGMATAWLGGLVLASDRRLGLDMVSARVWGSVAGALMLSCVMMLWDGRQARSDQLLVLWTTLSMGMLWVVLTRDRWSLFWWCGLWLSVGMGILSKGPLTPMVVVLSVVGFALLRRDVWGVLKRAKVLLGLVVAVVPIVPWVLAVMSEVGASEYIEIIRAETLGRSASAKEGHWGPPGYHLLLLPLMFWPGSLVTLAAFVGLVRRVVWRKSGRGDERAAFACFLIAWVVPSWIVFELVSTKLPHYTLSLYPGLAIVSSWGLASASQERLRGWSEKHKVLPYGVFFVLGLAVIGLPVFGGGLVGDGSRSWGEGIFSSGTGLLCVGLSVVGFGLLLWSVVAGGKRGLRTIRVQVAAIGCSVLASVGFFAAAQPMGWSVFQSPRFVEQVVAAGGEDVVFGDRPIAAVTYREDSLLFLTRGVAERVGRRELDAWFEVNPDGLAIVDSSWLEARPDEVVTELAPFGETVRGFNYSSGNVVDAVLVERAD